jgi:hypothetical protein
MDPANGRQGSSGAAPRRSARPGRPRGPVQRACSKGPRTLPSSARGDPSHPEKPTTAGKKPTATKPTERCTPTDRTGPNGPNTSHKTVAVGGMFSPLPSRLSACSGGGAGRGRFHKRAGEPAEGGAPTMDGCAGARRGFSASEGGGLCSDLRVEAVQAAVEPGQHDCMCEGHVRRASHVPARLPSGRLARRAK